MNITKIPVGYLQANCYILDKDDEVIIIDPGDDFSKINDIIKNKKIIKILVTHFHQDHIGALKYFDQNLLLKNPKEQTYSFGPFTFNVIFTRGHTADSVTYYFEKEKAMFTGDFLFKETIGRTDMSSGDISQMKESLNIIKKYTQDIKIYPGHGPSTTLKHEIEHNYFLK